MSFGVGVEQMIRAGIVLVDALLDQPHAEHAGIEVEVLLRRPGDRRDVMKTVDSCDDTSAVIRDSLKSDRPAERDGCEHKGWREAASVAQAVAPTENRRTMPGSRRTWRSIRSSAS